MGMLWAGRALLKTKLQIMGTLLEISGKESLSQPLGRIVPQTREGRTERERVLLRPLKCGVVWGKPEGELANQKCYWD